MKRVLKSLSVFLMFVLAMTLSVGVTNEVGASAQITNSYAKKGYIKSVTAITEVMPDGEKVSAIAVEYNKDINSLNLTSSDFSVNGRTITKVYANTVAAKASKGVNGKYIIIELSTNDSNAATVTSQGEGRNSYLVRGDVKVSVMQLKDIKNVDGSICKATSEKVYNNKEINLVVDDFKKLEYTDSTTGVTLKYSLYIPKDYDSTKSYPMVTFIHDLSLVSKDDNIALTQGYGGVIFASPSEQAKHESFVLIPQFSEEIVSDNSKVTQQSDALIDLIDSLVEQYSIDKNRLYDTGQSMGCMSSIGLNIKNPDKFAGLLLVAGQWDTSQVSVLKDKNIWAIVAEGDESANPGMTAIMDTLEKAGAKVTRSLWDGRATKEEQNTNVKEVLKNGTKINFTLLKNGTVVPEAEIAANPNMASVLNHMRTWQVAYQIEGVRDWLFTQVKSSTK